MGQRLRVSDQETRFLAFAEIYRRLSEPKTQRRAFALLEAAIASIAKHGFERVTLASIAREAGVSRPLLKHYFKGREEILTTAVKYIRLLFQRLAIAELLKGQTPEEQLHRYLDSCFAWTLHFRRHAVVWLNFLHRCASNAELRDLNTEAVRAGNERIQAMLESGRAAGAFEFADAELTATLMQNLITGGLVCLVSEAHADVPTHRTRIREACLRLVRAP